MPPSSSRRVWHPPLPPGHPPPSQSCPAHRPLHHMSAQLVAGGAPLHHMSAQLVEGGAPHHMSAQLVEGGASRAHSAGSVTSNEAMRISAFILHMDTRFSDATYALPSSASASAMSMNPNPSAHAHQTATSPGKMPPREHPTSYHHCGGVPSLFSSVAAVVLEPRRVHLARGATRRFV